MGDSSHGRKKGSNHRISGDGYDELQEQMADAAGDAARSAADSIAQAVGAITVALGLKAAKPIAETAEDLGIVLGEVLSNFARQRDGDWEDLEIVVIGRDEDEV
tara:strand:+ start:491 stop:802 length:312 start_codon:yes stop_codon:yes gene_type:complete